MLLSKTTTTPTNRFWTHPETEWSPQPTQTPSESRPASRKGDSTISPIYFDLEIKRTLEECGSWEEVRKSGGISIGCYWADSDGFPTFFDEQSLPETVARFEDSDILVSFNGKWFDVPLCESILGRKIILKEHFDVFRSIKDALNRVGKSWKGHGLDAVAQRTLGIGKNGRSEDAPRLARDGKWIELANYVQRDVIITRELTNFVRTHQHIVDVDGDLLYIDVPEWFRLAK